VSARPSENQAVPSRLRALLLLLLLLLLQPLASSASTKQAKATKAGSLQSTTPAARKEGRGGREGGVSLLLFVLWRVEVSRRLARRRASVRVALRLDSGI